MSSIGICRDSGAIYEGASPDRVFRIHPAPFLTAIRFSSGEPLRPVNYYAFSLPDLIFREADFEPVTKVRRGSVYSMQGQQIQPWKWRVQDPLRQDLTTEKWAYGVAQTLDLVTYHQDRLDEIAKRKGTTLPKVVLGWEPFITFWTISSIEHSATSQPLLTLRSHHTLTDLPALHASEIPPEALGAITEAMEKVENSMNRLSAVEVVDRCRDALSILFGALAGNLKLDLGDAIAAYVAANGGKDDLRSHAGRIVARLHSRGKPNERRSKSVPPPSDDDALLAVRCLKKVLVESNWAS